MEVHFKQGKTEGPEEGRKIKTRSWVSLPGSKSWSNLQSFFLLVEKYRNSKKYKYKNIIEQSFERYESQE